MKIGIKGNLSDYEFANIQNELKNEGIEVNKFHTKSEVISYFLQFIIDDFNVIEFSRDFIFSSFITLVFSKVYKKIKKVFNKNKNTISFWFILKLAKKGNDNLIVNFVCSENDFEKAIKKANDVINSSIFENYNTDNPLWISYENSKLGVLITRNDNKSELIEYHDNDNNFKNIPSSWKVAKLGDICETTSGGTPSRKRLDYYNGNIPWLKSGELKNNIILKSEEFINDEALNNSSSKIFPKGTLLIALYGATVGKLGILGIDAATNQAICAIYKSAVLETKFLFYYFFYIRSFLLESRIGGAQPNISQLVIRNTVIPIPPLAEQHLIVTKIEELFSQLDIAVDSLKKAKEQIASYKQSVLKAAFSGVLQNEKSFSMQNVECRIKNEELGIVDKRFIETTIGEVALVNPKLSNIPADDSFVTFLPMKLVEAKTGIFHLTEKKLFKEVKKGFTQFQNNDVIFAKITPCMENGKIALLDNLVNGIGCGSTEFHVIRVDKTKVNSKFMLYFLLQDSYRKEAKSNMKGTAGQLRVPADFILNSKFYIVNLSQQDEIVSEIEKRFSEAENLEKAINLGLKQAESLRQSILKNAFEGKLVDNEE